MDRSMNRAAAAALLGVDADADPDEVRRAYRVWVRIAHPDAGGDPEHFARVGEARRVLLQPVSQRPSAGVPPESWSVRNGPGPEVPAVVRVPLTSVAHRPRQWVLVALLGVMVIGLAALPLAGLSLVVAAALAGVASSAWAVLVARSSLAPEADTGHLMAVIALAWIPLAVLLVAVSAVMGTGFVSVLPVVALPLVAVVGWLNAGAGLWRPVMAPKAR